MKHSLIALGCSLALAGGNALAAQDTAKTPPSHTESSSTSSSGGGFVEKTKEAFHKLGQSVKNGFHKAEDKTSSAKSNDKDSTKSMGAGSASTAGSDRDKRMDSAYDDYKNKPASGEHPKSSK